MVKHLSSRLSMAAVLSLILISGAMAQQGFKITGDRVTTTSESGVHRIEGVQISTPTGWIISAAHGERRETNVNLEGTAQIRDAAGNLQGTATGVNYSSRQGSFTADTLSLGDGEVEFTCRNGVSRANGQVVPSGSFCQGGMKVSCNGDRIHIEISPTACPLEE